MASCRDSWFKRPRCPLSVLWEVLLAERSVPEETLFTITHARIKMFSCDFEGYCWYKGRVYRDSRGRLHRRWRLWRLPQLHGSRSYFNNPQLRAKCSWPGNKDHHPRIKPRGMLLSGLEGLLPIASWSPQCILVGSCFWPWWSQVNLIIPAARFQHAVFGKGNVARVD